MTARLLAAAAAGLAIERMAYILIWHFPVRFAAWCRHPVLGRVGGPVDVVRVLFYGFKVIQASVFGLWIHLHGGPQLAAAGVGAVLLGAALAIAGQTLNVSVFLRLGRVGVFYGRLFGCQVPWCRAFPFSMLSHPQYVGTVLSIWGLFLATRFPHPDWYLLPALETAYYVLGARLETDHPVLEQAYEIDAHIDRSSSG